MPDQHTTELRQHEQREDRLQAAYDVALARIHDEWDRDAQYALDWAKEDGVLDRDDVREALARVLVSAVERKPYTETIERALEAVRLIQTLHAEVRMHTDNV